VTRIRILNQSMRICQSHSCSSESSVPAFELAGIAGLFHVLRQAVPRVGHPAAEEATPEVVGGPWRPQQGTGGSPCLAPIFHFFEPLITVITHIVMQDFIHLKHISFFPSLLKCGEAQLF
jgi:hypothetical protein